MYTWEIEKFLKEHNGVVTKEEFYKVVNQIDNPQIEDVVYNGEYRSYSIKTNEGKELIVLTEK